jgi:hypothetical protein
MQQSVDSGSERRRQQEKKGDAPLAFVLKKELQKKIVDSRARV